MDPILTLEIAKFFDSYSEKAYSVGGLLLLTNRIATAAARNAIPTHRSLESSTRAPYAQIATPTMASAKRSGTVPGGLVVGPREARKNITVVRYG